MVPHMKTTIEIADPLLEQVRTLAAAEGTTLRELVETGLRLVLRERPRRVGFRFRDSRFGGRGLQHDFRDGQWSALRETIYDPERS